MPIFDSKYIVRLTRDIFKACGCPENEAEIVARNLVETSLLGLDSHGVMRVPQYVQAILDGKGDGAIKPGAKITVLNDKGSTAIIDCGGNFGQVGGYKAMQIAIEKARTHGIACVITKNCNHAGRLGAFTQMATEAGMVALATCNSPKHGHWVAPFGGREGRLATNPFSFAAPTNGNPVVLDMSTSAVSEGKVRLCFNSGQQVPPDCIADSQGVATTDPTKFYATPRGTIKPFGGAGGYKGTGLGMMVEILSGTLKGALVTDEHIIGNGLCFIVINIANFVSTDQFRVLTDELVAYVKSSPPAQDSKGVVAPGELDFKIKEQRLAAGMPIDETTWAKILEIAQQLKVSTDKNAL
jgi:uncharacterized oxidoreductase